MNDYSALSDDILLKRLRESDNKAFAAIFSRYYVSLVLYCNSWITERTECEDIVQAVFIELWEQRKKLRVTSLRSFLLRCTRNDCLDAIKHRKIVETYASKIASVIAGENNPKAADTYVLYRELETIIAETLDRLDKNAVAAFKMSRWDGKKYDEIASEMGVSRRTVEVRVTKVVQQLRMELQKHFPFLAK